MWPAAARWPPAVAPPFTSTSGLRGRHGAGPLEEARGRRARPRRRRGRPRWRRIVGVEVEVVGDRDRRRVARRHRPAHADARLHRVVHERRDEVARLRRDADRRRPAGRAPRSARTGDAGVDTTPWPFGPGDEHARARRPARPARPGAAGPPPPPRRSRPTRGTRRGCPSWRRRGAGRGWPTPGCTRTRGRSRRRAGRRCRPPPARRGRRPARGSSRRPRPGSPEARMLWRLTKPNLPGWVDTPATRTPRGSNSAWKPAGSTAITPPRPGRRRPPAGRRRRSAG